MKIAVAMIVAFAALPAPAQEKTELAVLLDLAVDTVPQEIAGIGHPDLEGLRHANFAIAATTIRGAEEHFADFASDLHGRVIAEELISSYTERGRTVERIESSGVGNIRVLPLDEFESGTHDYDWAALVEQFPDVKAIVRISRPAVDRLGTYAIVRYEFLTPNGRAWASFLEFVKQGNRSWKHTRGRIGDLW